LTKVFFKNRIEGSTRKETNKEMSTERDILCLCLGL